MNDMTPDKIKDLLETAIRNNTTAFAAQNQYFDSIVKRNMASFAALSDARIKSLEEINQSQTFNQAFEANLAFEEQVREGLVRLQEENAKSWQGLMDQMQAIYTPATQTAKPAKAAAGKSQAKTAPARKTTRKAA